jgi:hypothetical protein
MGQGHGPTRSRGFGAGAWLGPHAARNPGPGWAHGLRTQAPSGTYGLGLSCPRRGWQGGAAACITASPPHVRPTACQRVCVPGCEAWCRMLPATATYSIDQGGSALQPPTH